MSYILDALRRSEEERQRGTAPNLLTSQAAAAKETRKNRLLLLLILAVLLNACIFIWWLSPWRVVTHETARGKGSSTSSKPVTTLPAEGAAQSLQKGLVSQLKTEDLQKEVRVSPAPSVKRESGQSSSSLLPQETGKRVSSDHQQGSNAGSDSGKKLLSLRELPPSVQQGLPEMSITVHYYDSNPASRMVSINNRTMGEGQEFVAGLKLEEITPYGAIFSYQNYRFHLDLK